MGGAQYAIASFIDRGSLRSLDINRQGVAIPYPDCHAPKVALTVDSGRKRIVHPSLSDFKLQP